MRNGFRMKMTAICVGLVLAQFESGLALADSATGVDTALGNALNPPGRTSVPREVDPDGVDGVRHSPTGQLYGIPSLPATQNQTESGWSYNGGIEAGVVGVGKEGQKNSQSASQQFRQYKDLRNGLYLNYFEADADKPETAHFMQIFGGGAGQGDQFYGLQFGHYNDWKVKTFYSETTHVFTDTWKSLYNGEGTGTLTTGLAMPTIVTSGSMVSGTTPNYIGATATCSQSAPCWLYNGKTYGNSVALLAINGVTGTPDSVSGAIPTGVIGTTGSNGATNATQSNMAAAIAAKLAATPYSELSLIRKKGGVRGEVTLTDTWKGYASYTLENRVGARPFAMNDNNMSSEIAEPIDYNTHDILVGLSYKDERNQANLRASISKFINNIRTLDVQYELLGTTNGNGPFGVIQHGTFALAPDNDAFNVKGEFARNLPDLYKGRFTAAVSFGVNKQNDPLLAPYSAAQSADWAAAYAAGSISAANNTLFNNWNTTAALSQKTAKQEIDNRLVDLGLSLKPSEDLSVKGSYRFYETVNKGGYTAYNPLTGQFGRGPSTNQGVATMEVAVAPVMVNGLPTTTCYTLPGFPTVPSCSAATLVNGAGIPVFSEARSTKQTNVSISADYDLTRTSSLNGSIEHENFDRTFRERPQTAENKFKFGYVNRALGSTTVRASYEKDVKRGGEYNMLVRAADMATGLPGLTLAQQIAIESQGYVDPNTGVVTANPAAVTVNGVTYPALNANLYSRYSSLFRKYDQADRDQNILNARVNFMAREDLDLGINMQLKRAQYPNSFYGLQKDNLDSLGFELNFQPSSERTFTAFYNFQNGDKTMSMNSGIAGVGGALTNACTVVGQVFSVLGCADTTTGSNGARPYSSSWSSNTNDRNDVIGLGLQNDFGFVRLGIDYTFTKSSTHISYNFGSMAFSAPASFASPPTSTNNSQTANTATNNTYMASIAGNALPDMTTLQNTLTVNLVKPINKKSSVRLMYRYEDSKIADWHYDSVIHNALAAFDSGTLLLDSGPAPSTHTGVLALLYQLKM